MDQKSLIDFCIVSSDLFSDVLDVRVKRGAELSTDHHLVVCSLRLSKPWPNRRSNRSSVTYQIKWEALEDNEVRKQFASSISSKFRQLPNVSEDIEKEWLLFRSAIISSAAESCGRKRLRMAGDSEKRTPWWNQEVKEAIREIRKSLNIEPLLLRIERSQLRWFGHVSRMPQERLPKQALLAKANGRRSVGRPRTRWTDYIEDLGWNRLGIRPSEMMEVMEDREVWRLNLELLPPQPSRKSGQ